MGQLIGRWFGFEKNIDKCERPTTGAFLAVSEEMRERQLLILLY